MVKVKEDLILEIAGTKELSKVVYMSSKIFQLAVGLRELSQAEKKITAVTSWVIYKMTTLTILSEKRCYFVILLSL